MEYATSLAKSTYKGTKSAAKYMASYVMPTKKKPSTKTLPTDKNQKYSWLSCLIFFRIPRGKYILDQACILLGDVPSGYHGIFTNFTNWMVIDSKLYYTGEIYDKEKKLTKTMIEINPANVHIHIRVGDSILDKESFAENISDYQYYVPHSEHNVYKVIADQLSYEKVKIYDLSYEFGDLSSDTLQERTEKIHDPRFLTVKHQRYGKEMENIMYSGINPPVL